MFNQRKLIYLIAWLCFFLAGCAGLAHEVGRGYAKGIPPESYSKWGQGIGQGAIETFLKYQRVQPAIEDEATRKIWRETALEYLKKGRYDVAEKMFRQIADYEHLEEMILIYLDRENPERAYWLYDYLKNFGCQIDFKKAYQRIKKAGIYQFKFRLPFDKIFSSPEK